VTAMTEWYPLEIKPVRVGKYETVIDGDNFQIPIYRFWDGKRWTHTYSKYICVFQNRHWRGLASNPEVTK
jgi:hypothetical protein